MFAYHSEDPVSPMDIKHHEFRGVKSILLLSSVDTRNTGETGWMKIDLTARNVRKNEKKKKNEKLLAININLFVKNYDELHFCHQVSPVAYAFFGGGGGEGGGELPYENYGNVRRIASWKLS